MLFVVCDVLNVLNQCTNFCFTISIDIKCPSHRLIIAKFIDITMKKETRLKLRKEKKITTEIHSIV